MWLNPQETTDLISFNEETLIGNLHFLCSGCCKLGAYFIKQSSSDKYFYYAFYFNIVIINLVLNETTKFTMKLYKSIPTSMWF